MYLSGQIGIDPATGKLAGETVEEQTLQVIRNIEAILAAKGFTLENVVKSEVYLIDLQDFSSMNSIYGEKFSGTTRPARMTLQVSKLPLCARVKIACIAHITDTK